MKNLTGANGENGGCGIKLFANPKQRTVEFKKKTQSASSSFPLFSPVKRSD
jgi:hypothetical protein